MKYRIFTSGGMLTGELDCYDSRLRSALEKAGYRVELMQTTSAPPPRISEAGSIGGQMVKAMIAACI